MNHLKMTVAGLGMLMLTACNGIFDDIYDEPEEIVPAKGQIVMNATSWTDWYYVDLPKLQKLTEAGDEAALLKAQTEFEAYPIPMTATGEKDESDAGHAAATAGRKAGQYMYWFDVFGEGIKKNTFTYFEPTAEQTAPSEWTLAILATMCVPMAEPFWKPAILPWTSCLKPVKLFITSSLPKMNGLRMRFGIVRSRCFWVPCHRRASP